jgi:hypothetical protein
MIELVLGLAAGLALFLYAVGLLSTACTSWPANG